MIDLDWTLFMQIGNFLVLVFLLNMVLFKPIRGVIQARRQQLEGLATDVSGLSAKEQELRGDIDAEITAARKTGLGKRDMLKAEGGAVEASLVEAAKKEAEAQWTTMEQKIKDDLAAARQDLQPQVQSFAADLAAKILGRAIA